MKTKLKYLFVLIVLATVAVIVFQISWLKSSYKISREKMLIDASLLLDEAIVEHKEVVANRVRKLLIKAIRPQDLETAVHYDVKPEDTTVSISYHTTRMPNASWTSFRVTKSELENTIKNPYSVLLQNIKSANLDYLNGIYGTFVGQLDYEPNSLEEKLQDSLWRCFNLHEDTTSLNNIIQKKLAQTNEKLKTRISYLKGLYNIYTYKKSPVKNTTNNTEKIIEVPFRTGKWATLTEQLDSAQSYVTKLNLNDDKIYTCKAILDDINTILRSEVSVLILEIEVPKSYTLTNMFYNILGSGLMILLVGLCLTYMMYVILKQKKLSEIKDDFISNVSHELKTPVATTLAAIQGMQYFEVLEDKQKTDQYLNTAANEMKRLSIMIDTILNNSVYERNNYKLEISKFNLKEMLIEMINIQQIHSQKEVNISLNYTAKEEISADRTHIYQVILNLVDNATKYSKIKSQIIISCMQTTLGISIQISDNGIGIPQKFQNQIFDKFFRVPTPNDHKIKGYGLGLNYVKNIVEKHKGTVTLIKSDENGSTFEISLVQ